MHNPSFFSLKRTTEHVMRKGNYTTSTMGILIDVTNSLYRERDKDYITELKIIDETLNEDSVIGVMIKYCTVYVFSNQDMKMDFCNKIGQIIYLDHFTFQIWHNIKFQTKFLSRTENIICFEEENQTLKLVQSINKEYEIGQFIEKRGLMLSQWFKQYFFKNYKPLLGINLINSYTIMAEPFNMILRSLDGKKPLQMQTEMKAEGEGAEIYNFEDANGNKFFIKSSNFKNPLPDSEYVFLRGVNCIGNYYEIKLIETGNIIGLPSYCGKQYEEMMNYCAVARFNERFLLNSQKRCLLSRLTDIVPQKKTYLSSLMKNIDLYENKESKRGEVRISDNYYIQVVAINFQGDLFMFHTDHQIIIDEHFLNALSDDEKKELIDEKKISYLYEGTLGVIDRSNENSGKIFNVHLFSNEKRTHFYDSEMMDKLVERASFDFTNEEMKNVKNQIEKKLANLIEKSSFSNPISMLVEPIKADNLIYRLTNTIFE